MKLLALAGFVIAAAVFPYPARTAAEPPSFANAAVVSVDPIASNVGVDILRKGGNAVDAAVTTGLALAVTWPASANLGVGGFMVIYLADKGDATATISVR